MKILSAALVVFLGTLTALGASSASPIAGPAVVAHTLAVRHTFTDGADGGYPWVGLIQDRAGNLFGTAETGGAYKNGVVFELSPDGKGGWNYRVIYSMTGNEDAGFPEASLTFDGRGNLYGTTVGNPNGHHGNGAVFELSPNQRGPWTLTRFHDFSGGGLGSKPAAGVVIDASGNLYGTTEQGGSSCNCGVAFEMSPTPSGWTETLIHTFTGGADGADPDKNLLLDRNGDLYGVAPYGGSGGAGLVFRLSKGASGWTETVLHAFYAPTDGMNPQSKLIFDRAGNLFGTNAQNGVYELTRPTPGKAGWQFVSLYSFNGGAAGGWPYSGLVFDAAGNLYGATSAGGNQSCSNGGCGVVYELTPAKGGSWTESVVWTFNGPQDPATSGADGTNPYPDLIFGLDGNLYGTTLFGGRGYGVVFQITK